MNVFVWKAYGDIEVYAADTQEQLNILFNSICNAVVDWDLDSIIIETHIQIEKLNFSESALRKGINKLLDHINIGSHESFERGTGFTTVKHY